MNCNRLSLVSPTLFTFNVDREEADDRHGDGQDQQALAHHVVDDINDVVIERIRVILVRI